MIQQKTLQNIQNAWNSGIYELKQHNNPLKMTSTKLFEPPSVPKPLNTDNDVYHQEFDADDIHYERVNVGYKHGEAWEEWVRGEIPEIDIPVDSYEDLLKLDVGTYKNKDHDSIVVIVEKIGEAKEVCIKIPDSDPIVYQRVKVGNDWVDRLIKDGTIRRV